MLNFILNRLMINIIIGKIFSQNENVNREVSSLQMYQHKFNFREVIWSQFFRLNN